MADTYVKWVATSLNFYNDSKNIFLQALMLKPVPTGRG